jgi:hypothetical protein
VFALVVADRTSVKFTVSGGFAVVHKELQLLVASRATLSLQHMLVGRLNVGVSSDLANIARLFFVAPSKAAIGKSDKGFVALHVFFTHSIVVEIKDNDFAVPVIIGINAGYNTATYDDHDSVLV